MMNRSLQDKRYGSRQVKTPVEGGQKMDYIHNNPVRAGLCKVPEEYKYSSAEHYLLNKSEWDFKATYDE